MPAPSQPHPPAKKKARRQAGPLFSLLTALFLALVLGVVVVRLAFAVHTRPAWRDPLLVPSTPYGMTAEPVQITTKEGVLLRGHFLAGAGPAAGQATVVLLHDDAKRGMYDMVPTYAPALVQAGYNVLAVSFRGYGASAGEMLGTFWFGQDRATSDVAAMLDWLAARPETQGHPVALLALGDAALPALRSAGRVQALVLDSPPSVAADAWGEEYPWTRRLPGIRGLIKVVGSVAYQHSLFGREPMDWAKQVQAPTLLLQGAKDSRQAAGLRAALGRAELITVPDAPHVAAAPMYPDAYARAVLAHLAQHLLHQPGAASPASVAFVPEPATRAYAAAQAGRADLAAHRWPAAAESLSAAFTSNPADPTLRYLAGVAHISTRDAGPGAQLLAPLALPPPAAAAGPDRAALQCWSQVWLGHALDLQFEREAALQQYASASGCAAVGPDPSGLEPTGPQERARWWLNQAYTTPLR